MAVKKSIVLILVVLLLAGCAAPQQEPEQTAPPQVEASQTDVQPEAAPTDVQPVEETVPKTILLTAEEVTLEDAEQTVNIYCGTADPESVTWTSENDAVATVQGGVITALERGETVVTATYEDQVLTCRVICDLPVPMRLNEAAGERDPVYLAPDVEIVDDAFFDDAVFISDSQGLVFYNCVKYAGVLDGAVHLCRNSYSIDSAANNKMLLSWRGRDYRIEDAIALTGAKRVFIMLGINDVGHYDISQVDQIMENWVTVIDRIQTRTPDVQICIQSLIPVWTGGETEKVNNEIVRAYNEQLEILAEEKGCVFIDVAAYFVDSTGGLAYPYTNDKYVHTNAAGVDTWVKVLKACTDYE